MTMMPPQTAAVPPPPDLGKPSNTARIVVAVVAFATLMLLIWSLTAPLNRGVIATGRIDVDSRRTIVKHKDGGILAENLVREGERVQVGQIIATMDDRETKVQLSLLQQARLQNLIESTVRKAEISGAGSLAWPQDVIEAIGDPASDAAQWASVQTSAFQARKSALSSQTSILREQRDRMRARIAGLNSTEASLMSQSALISEETSSLYNLQRQGFAPKNRVLAMQRAGADIDGRIGDNRSTIAQSRIAIGETELQIVQTRAEFIEQSARRLSELYVQLAELNDRITGQKLIIERSVIRAPVEGVVLARIAGGQGMVVQPSESLFEIVPSDKLVVRAEVRPTDIERIQVGEAARLRFSGLNAQTTPQIDAAVTFVGADAQTNQQSGYTFYEMRLEVTTEQLRRLGDVSLRSGMPVEVLTDGGARTAWQYMIEPIVRTYEKSFRE